MNGYRVAVCMPVGPAGIKAETAQFLCALVASSNAQQLALASGHLIRARNAAWAAALANKAERVLWLDADVFTAVDAYEAFAKRAELCFAEMPSAAWYGAVCMRRGPHGLVNFCYDDSRLDARIRAGLGLAYWHVPRMRQALALVGADAPFRWVEPIGEDYRASDDVHDNGYRVVIDTRCPTEHIDVGVWAGDYDEAAENRLRAEMDRARMRNASGAV